MQELTLRAVFTEYKKSRKLKPKTLNNYNHRFNSCFSDWLDLDIRKITKNMVEERHKAIQGEAMANSACRTLKAVFNYAIAKYESDTGEQLVPLNPVHRLTAVSGWYRDKFRIGCLAPSDFRPWFKAVRGLYNTGARDFFIIVLLTGMRLSEARNLNWDQVDFSAGAIALTNTKNGDDRIVPVSDYVYELLRHMQRHSAGPMVFEGKRYCLTLRLGTSAIDLALKQVRDESGVMFTVHDLRRTYVTMGDYLDEKVEVVRELVGHRNKSMTDSYIIRSMERLRRTTENINNAILRFAEEPPAQPQPSRYGEMMRKAISGYLPFNGGV